VPERPPDGEVVGEGVFVVSVILAIPRLKYCTAVE
jgi:hypothetical protein